MTKHFVVDNDTGIGVDTGVVVIFVILVVFVVQADDAGADAVELMMKMIMCALHTTTIRVNDATSMERDGAQGGVGPIDAWTRTHD